MNPASLQAAVEAQIAAGTPGALARLEAADGELIWAGSAGNLARGDSRLLPEQAKCPL